MIELPLQSAAKMPDDLTDILQARPCTYNLNRGHAAPSLFRSFYDFVSQAISSQDACFICRHFTTATLYALGCFLLAFSGSTNAAGFETYGGKITERDKQTLPPVCRLILFEKPSAHQPEGQRTYGDLLSLPEYRMAKNNIHLHHYCYGLLSRFRYFSSTSPIDRNLFAKKVQDELDYVIVNQEISDKSWPG